MSRHVSSSSAGAHKFPDNPSALNRIARVIEGISIPAGVARKPSYPISGIRPVCPAYDDPFDYENVSLDYAGSRHRAIANLRRDPAILGG